MYSLEALLVPIQSLYLIAFGFGVIIGSFLNVYIYRFHTGKSLSGHSHCLSCGTGLRWFELFPLLSYLALRGRCRTCGCKIPSRYFLVELCTGLLFSLSLTLTLDVIAIGLLWVIFSLLVIITVYDLYHFIIPDSLTLILTVMVVLSIVYDFTQYPIEINVLVWQVVAALFGSAFLFFLWFISNGTWLGFGDVKLAIPLGLLVGTEQVFSFIVLSFWVGAIISLLIIGYLKIRRGKDSLHLNGIGLTMKSAVPFAPFLVASCLIILLTHFNVLELFSFT
ncbi:MAG: leader peptidase (prepilin peptidase)/N-methyltransferase [Candidatus Paceibacteria bacterium]|jgi:leader peptidase (prepilin peptidase)/N-methyltransferase